MSQLTSTDFQTYPSTPAAEDAITPGPNALFSVSLDSLLPTQMNEGFAEVDKKADGFNDLTPSQLQASLLTDIEPVVIGPDGKLYLTDGHHTFTALADSAYGATDPTVYVNVIANYSGDTEAQFFAAMQANNLLLPLNDGVPQTVDDATGAPIPTSLTSLTSDPYRGLEYSILKNKSSKLFTTTSNITGSVGAATPGLDKMTGFYSDFLEADAYRDANGGKGLPYLSPGDIALATQWNLTGSNLTTLPNVAGSVHVYQLPGYILNASIVNSGGISNTTLANGAMDGSGTFTGITQINAGTVANPIMIGTPNTGFIMQLGADKGFTVTLNGANTYTGGTSILAGTLIIAGDSSLGAATPGNAIDPAHVKTSVQSDNGIVFNSLTEGNGTLQIGTAAGNGTSTFSTARPIAVGGEAASINLNGYIVTLNGQIASLGTNGVGIGNATGFSDLTVEDTSSAANGVLKLSTTADNSNFYGNWVITSGTLQVSSDASLGNTTGPADEIGQIEFNGGTLQAGASFGSVRSLFLAGGSTFDTNGFTTSWGSLTDVQRTLTVENSSTTSAGAATFGSFAIGSTAILAVDAGTGIAGGEGTTVTFTGGITRDGNTDAGAPANATLFIDPSAGSTLGSSAANGVEVFSSGASTTLTHGIAPTWIVTDSGGSPSSNPYNFVTYSAANGYTAATYTGTFGASNVVAVSSSSTISNSAAFALNIQNGKTLTINSGNTLTVGDSTDPAGLILEGTAAITGGTLAFGASEAAIDVKATNTVSSAVTGTGGLTLSGSGTLVLSGTAGGLSGPIIVDSGTLQLNTANYFNTGTTVWLSNVKSKPSNSILAINSTQTLSAINSDGNNSSITIATGDTLTIGDATNNFSSTLSSVITATGSGSLVKAGSGLLDISGSGGASFVTGTVAVQGGALRIANGIFSATATTAINLAAGTELQYEGNAGSKFNDPITGGGIFHLLSGTVQLIGTTNTYSGGTVIETGATLDVTTANLPTGGNIVNAGGILDFDQASSGTFSGVMSDGLEAGGPNDPNALAATAYGPSLSGNLIKDDSTGANSGNVTIANAQTYTGATYVEAGTLTLGAVDTIADSSGVTLGRVGGGATATLVLNANNTLTSLSDDASNTTSVVLNGHTLTLSPTTTSVSSFGGTISDGSGTGSVVADGTGTVTLSGDNTFGGGITIDSGTLELGNANAAGTGAITFANDPTLEIDGTTIPTNTIDGFVTGDTIDLASIANVAGSHADMNYATKVLTITEGSSTYTLQFDPTANFTGDYFHLTSGNGTDINENATPCYCPGTLILTDRGEIAVEDLAIGDKVMTKRGVARPVKWIGRRNYGGRFCMGRKDILPVCIKAGALDDDVPRRDLWISPHHAMYFAGRHLEGVLVEAKDLVNGVSIVQAERVEKVAYFHVELDSHDVIVAEGALAESFVDDDSRGLFHNAHDYAALYPDAVSGLAQYCAPRLSDGYEVEAARRRIAIRAGLRPADAAPGVGTLRGYVDAITLRRVIGWAQNVDHPEAPVCLDIYAGDVLIGQVLASRYRDGLKRNGFGSGNHEFKFVVPAGLIFDPATVQVRRSLDGARLTLSHACKAEAATIAA